MPAHMIPAEPHPRSRPPIQARTRKYASRRTGEFKLGGTNWVQSQMQHLAVDFASFLRLLKSRTQISQSSPAETSLVVPSVPTTTTRHRTASMWPLRFSTGPCRGERLTSASKWNFLQHGKTYLKYLPGALGDRTGISRHFRFQHKLSPHSSTCKRVEPPDRRVRIVSQVAFSRQTESAHYNSHTGTLSARRSEEHLLSR